MQVLLRSGAAIDALCFNNHPHSTALSLAIHFCDLKLASFLISKGANPHVMDLTSTMEEQSMHFSLRVLTLTLRKAHARIQF
jgi:ankyrin repeat protein